MEMEERAKGISVLEIHRDECQRVPWFARMLILIKKKRKRKILAAF